MRPAAYAALWKYFSFCLVVSVLCYVGYLQPAQNHLDLLHARLWAEAVCDPGVAQLNYIIWGCASCWPCVVSCLPFLWPCPPAAVWELCCLPFPRLDVCARVLAILNQKCTVCASDETAWKESSVLSGTVLRPDEQVKSWTLSKSWQILVGLDGRTLC